MDSENFELDAEKLKAVILHVCKRVNQASLGKVKLHKILYFADMLWYLRTGQPMMGVRYQKQEYGPMARGLSAILKQLESDGNLKLQRRDFYGFEKTDFLVVGTAPEYSNRLSKEELELLGIVTEFVCEKTAKEISDLSHNAAWRAATIGEEIPYFTVYGWSQNEITDQDLAAATAIAATLPSKDSVKWYD